MSEADRLFEELGYITFGKHPSLTYLLRYYKNDDNVIYFENDKTFYKSGEYSEFCDSITMEELKAINKKCEELGWI